MGQATDLAARMEETAMPGPALTTRRYPDPGRRVRRSGAAGATAWQGVGRRGGDERAGEDELPREAGARAESEGGDTDAGQEVTAIIGAGDGGAETD